MGGGTKLLSELPDKTALIIADNEAYRNKDGGLQSLLSQ